MGFPFAVGADHVTVAWPSPAWTFEMAGAAGVPGSATWKARYFVRSPCPGTVCVSLRMCVVPRALYSLSDVLHDPSADTGIVTELSAVALAKAVARLVCDGVVLPSDVWVEPSVTCTAVAGAEGVPCPVTTAAIPVTVPICVDELPASEAVNAVGTAIATEFAGALLPSWLATAL